MNKIFKLSALVLAAFLAFTGCQKEFLSTDQFSDTGLSFSAFSPNPVYRGGEITIIGSNLDQVSEIRLPGVDPITNFNVTGSGRECRLTFTVPVDGPEEGNITIVSKNGTAIKSVATLTYTEPIVFTSFSPASAMPGDIITIKGDYLNLVQEVIFEGGAYVTEFGTQSRNELKLTVPANAISGRLIVGDSNEVLDPDKVANKVYSEAELTIGDPTVDGLEVKAAKPGETVTISGEYLNMIQSVVFTGETEVTDFTVRLHNKELLVSIPATAQSGEVVAVSYAGKEFTAGTIEMVKPGNLAVAPAPVKAGSELTISGKDLDIVTSVSFPNAGEVDFVYSNNKIVANVPAKATEGDVTLTMDNGDAVTVAFTLVHPTVTSVSPTDLMAGEVITVKGTDLDLVTKATLGGKEEEFEIAGGDLSIQTTNTSVSGKIVLTLANGETVEPVEDIALTYDSFIIVNEMPAAEHIGAIVTLKGENFMLIENIYIGEKKVTGYVMRSDTEIQFTMPFNKVGVYSMYFDLLSGERETCPNTIEVLLEQNITVIWEGYEDLGSWSNQPFFGDETAFSDLADVLIGDKVRVYYTPLDDWYQIQVFGGHWEGLTFPELGGSNTISPQTMPTYTGFFEFAVTADNVGILRHAAENWGGALLTQGENAAVTMVTAIHEIPQEKDLWEGEEDLGSWSNQPFFGAEGALVDLGAAPGMVMRIYFTPTADWWQIQIFDGHWGALNLDELGGGQLANPDTTTATSCLEFVMTDEIFAQLTDIQGWGGTLLCQGEGVIITRIAFI